VDGVVCLPFFSYTDRDGVMHKPFLLPQRDPSAYVTEVFNFHMPQLITGRIPLKACDFIRSDYDQENIVQAKADPKLPIPKAKKDGGSPLWSPIELQNH
jgi:hypothetical protein